MQCFITGKLSNQVAYCDETKKRDLTSQTVRLKKSKLSHGGPSQRQASGTEPPMSVLSQSRH